MTYERDGSLDRIRHWGLTLCALTGALSYGCSGAVQTAEPGDAMPLSSATQSITLQTSVAHKYLVAENGGGDVVNANRDVAAGWETFTLYDLNGGELSDGDSIELAASNGQFLCAENGGGGAVNANRATPLDWETFTIHKIGASGVIKTGDQISLQTKTRGLYLSAQDGGGSTLVADRIAVQAWETFVFAKAGTTPPPPPPPSDGGTTPPPPPPPPPPASNVKVIAYLPNYSGSYADWARKIDFRKMTHMNLAFATPNGNNDWSMGASDGDVKALVDAAHAAGVKVLASLGGGGGDQAVIARYRDANNIDALVAKLDTFVAAHNFDGADMDIEDGGQLGANYSTFVAKTIAKLRPKGKLVTAAVAEYLQGGMSDATLHSFDFINVMIYTNYNDSVNALNFYANQKQVPKNLITLGAGFFGTDSSYTEYSYVDIMRADGNAWSKDQAQVNGRTVTYTGMASMKKLAEYSKGYGGIMFWELSEDVTDAHSLWKVIQDTM
jgi:chitinase